MTLYLTNSTTPNEIRLARYNIGHFVHDLLERQSGRVMAVKLYPQGATTHSDSGVSVTDASALKSLYPVFAALVECDVPLLVHGELNHPSVHHCAFIRLTFCRSMCLIASAPLSTL